MQAGEHKETRTVLMTEVVVLPQPNCSHVSWSSQLKEGQESLNHFAEFFLGVVTNTKALVCRFLKGS